MHNIHVLYYVAMQNKVTGEIVFYVKGADSVMTSIVQYSDWLEEEVESYNIQCIHYEYQMTIITLSTFLTLISRNTHTFTCVPSLSYITVW